MIVSDLFNVLPINLAYQRGIPNHIYISSSLGGLWIIIGISKGEISATLLKAHIAQQFIDSLSLAEGLILNSIGQLEEEFIDKFRSQMTTLSNLPIRFVAPLMSTLCEKETKENVRIQVHLHYSN
jgi:hypothetical protein